MRASMCVLTSAPLPPPLPSPLLLTEAVRLLSPHSLYIKDPSGVLTPEMAGILAGEIKSRFPHLPLIFHTHYQTGFAYMSYLTAVKNGANGIETSLGFADGAGQPYGLTMLRALEEEGFETGQYVQGKRGKQ